MHRYLLMLMLGAFCLINATAQSPLPIVVQDASHAPAVAAKPAASAPVADKKAEILQQLNDMAATNAATIKQQEAALATLDELQKAADEIKIFSKRG